MLLSLHRSGLAYEPVRAVKDDLALMRQIDEIYLRRPYYGSRRVVEALQRSGLHVTAGRARGVVFATGGATEIGRIATLAARAKPPKTPLERRIDRFGRLVMIVGCLLFAAIVAIGLARQLPLVDVLMIGISQMVGIVPESLPVAMTIALAVGVQRMARRRALVRRLSAVETLGSTTVICTDKTGTLTRNEMTITSIFLPGRGAIAVSGAGYSPEGVFSEGGKQLSAPDDPALRELLEAAVLCNDAQLAPPDAEDARWRPIGDPTEAAFLTAAAKAGLVLEEIRGRSPRKAEIPFDSATKWMATGHDSPSGARVYLKGGPEVIRELCGTVREAGRAVPLDAGGRARLEDASEEMASRALRVLAIAVVEGVTLDPAAGGAALHGRATLLGLVGQMDPPRAEVAEAVARCRAAGIRPIMVTGDHKATAVAIGRQVGIARDEDLALDGAELAALSDEDLAATIDRVSVFARVHPAQKLRIVETLQRQHHVVAMTGDGVNDAPALVRADVGVAMGVTGTEVAKHAAKIVIADDDFATIVAAVEEGRVVYRNIKKATLFLVTTSAAEVVVLMAALLLGYPPPFAAVQILWNNLVTEGVITINLIMDPAEGHEMQQPPTRPDEPLLPAALLARMLVMTPAIVISTLGWFAYRLSAGVSMPEARTEAFTLLAICEWFNVLNCRSDLKSAFDRSLLRNRWLLAGILVGNLLQAAVIFLPPLNRVFHTVPLSLGQVVILGVVGSLVLWVEEARKLYRRGRAAEQSSRSAAQDVRPADRASASLALGGQ